MKKTFFLCLLLFWGFEGVFASNNDNGELQEHQKYSKEKKFNTWSLSVGGGPFFYYADILNYTVFPEDNYQFGLNATLTKQLNPAWAVEIQASMADAYGEKGVRYFEGNIWDASINLVTYINHLTSSRGPVGDKWNFYTKIGFGYSAYRSKLRWNYDNNAIIRVGEIDKFSPEYPATGIENNPYYVVGYDSSNPDRKTSAKRSVMVPISVGVKHRLSRSFDLGMEFSLRNMAEDDFDNIILEPENDRYAYIQLNLIYKIGKKDKRHSSWTYRDLELTAFGLKKVDPIQFEIRQLEKEIASFSNQKINSNDTVRIVNNHSLEIRLKRINSVFFNHSDFTPDNENTKTIAETVSYLKKHPDSKVKLIGYSDNSGASELNYELSEKRCESIRSSMIEDFGIEESRITIVNKGEENPLVKSERLKRLNRRVDLVIID